MKSNNKIVWALIMYLICLFTWYFWCMPHDTNRIQFLKELEKLERSLDSLKKRKQQLDSTKHLPTYLIDSLKSNPTKPYPYGWLSK